MSEPLSTEELARLAADQRAVVQPETIIVRLLATIEEWQGHYGDIRLTAEAHEATIDALQAENARLTSEVSRLRGALEKWYEADRGYLEGACTMRDLDAATRALRAVHEEHGNG